MFVEAGTGRTAKPIRFVNETIWVKASSADTLGKYTMFENHIPPDGGPPLHVHHREDEWFYVLEGTFVFEVDGRPMTAKVGDSLLAPRDIPHRFLNVGRETGRLLGMVEPGGFEHFFQELAAALNGAPEFVPELLMPIAGKYGLELLGPPLTPPAGG